MRSYRRPRSSPLHRTELARSSQGGDRYAFSRRTAATRAVLIPFSAAQLALAGDGLHSVSLDEAIEAMRVTARDSAYHPSLSPCAATLTVAL